MNNKYEVYRNIRYARAFRTLGKMSLWRIVLGVVLIIYVLLLSGFVSQMLAARGMFHAADKMMISPAWMEDYKPETKAFIEAGVLYQDGDYDAAAAAFESIEDYDAATSMLSLTNLKIALDEYASGNVDASYTALTKVEFSLLSEDDGLEYLELCATLREHYSAVDAEKARILQDMLDANS